MNMDMRKNSDHSQICLTHFQELVYYHSKDKLSTKYPKLIETGEPKWIASEILENNELEIFKAFRSYQQSEEICPTEPKTPILAYLYLFDQFLECHCRMVAESIASK